jgi:hypothetical protein
MNNLDRIATRNYVVTDQDIVRARLRTVGIQEHRLFFERGPWGQAKCWLSFILYLVCSAVTDVAV